MDILIVDDEKSIRESTVLALETLGYYAEGVPHSEAALQRLKEDPFQIVIVDLHLGEESGLDLLKQIHKIDPSLPVVLFTAKASIQAAVEAIRLGAVDFLEKPFRIEQLRNTLNRITKVKKLETKIQELKEEVHSQNPEPRFYSSDPVMKGVYDVLYRAAESPASILILGESGTGKSLAARAAHQKSPYHHQAFVTVSCPSLSKELLESDLFGHVKGAFTGAVRDTWGKVKTAEGGTLFLDEIGELPLELQAKLLRLLQEREYERLGETQIRKANVRVIAATNQNLEDLVQQGKFREDLFYRLNVISVVMPPLRERSVDLQQFALEYLDFFNKHFGKSRKEFSPSALQAITQYSWPGNLRELRNTIERAVILSTNPTIELSDLPLNLIQKEKGSSKMPESPSLFHTEDIQQTRAEPDGSFLTLRELEIQHIQRVLKETSSLTTAAKLLGIDQATLYRKRKTYNLDAIS